MPEPDQKWVESSAHFSKRELACKCGCGEARMNALTMVRLEELRVMLDEGLPLSSARRCADHNRQVSSTGEFGPHTTGQGIDVRCSGAKAHRVAYAAFVCGFTGIGFAQKGPHKKRFIHLDDLPNGHGRPRPTIWSY